MQLPELSRMSCPVCLEHELQVDRVKLSTTPRGIHHLSYQALCDSCGWSLSRYVELSRHEAVSRLVCQDLAIEAHSSLLCHP